MTKENTPVEMIKVDVVGSRVFVIPPDVVRFSRAPDRVPIESIVYSQGSHYIAEESGLVQYDEKRVSDYLAKRLRKFIIENDRLPYNVSIRKISPKFAEFDLEIRSDHKDDAEYVFRFILRMDDVDVPGTISEFVGSFDKKSAYTKWWIETDPSGRASCRECGGKIAKGSKRFAMYGAYFGDSDSRSTIKKHIRCITKRDIGKANIKKVRGFHSLDEADKEWLVGTFTHKQKTWRSAITMSDSEFKSLDYPKLLQLQGRLLERMDCGIGNIDENILKNIRKSLVQLDIPFPEQRNRIIDIAINAAEKQVAKKGTTIFFDLDKWMENPKLIRLIPDVIELRKKETKTIVLNKVKDRIDLKPLWSTYYGYSILKIAHRHEGASTKTIDNVLKLFVDLNVKFEIKAEFDIKPPDNMSEAMMNYILFTGTEKKKYNAE